MRWLECTSSPSPVAVSAGNTCEDHIAFDIIRENNNNNNNMSMKVEKKEAAASASSCFKPVDALLCDYCACFVKERTVRCSSSSSSHSGIATTPEAENPVDLATEGGGGGGLDSPRKTPL